MSESSYSAAACRNVPPCAHALKSHYLASGNCGVMGCPCTGPRPDPVTPVYAGPRADLPVSVDCQEIRAEPPALNLQADLQALLGRYSIERRSDTPDHVLAAYLLACLIAYENAVSMRDRLAAT
jgi:hypothetical protein